MKKITEKNNLTDVELDIKIEKLKILLSMVKSFSEKVDFGLQRKENENIRNSIKKNKS